MKRLIAAVLGVMFSVGLGGMAVAGSLDSPGAPSGGSMMYTLQNLYDYLVSGSALTVQGSFQEPASAPGSTMKTTKQIGDAIKVLFEQCDVTVNDVALNKKFFCTQSGSWGVQTGRVCIAGTPTPTPTITPTPTLTPTYTPTPWGPTPCAAKSGWWGQNGLTGYGCWFVGNLGESCTTVCGNNGSLICDASMRWNDYGDCRICKHWYSGAGCQETDGPPESPDYYVDGTVCRVDSMQPIVAQDCAATNIHTRRFCVCVGM
ncbi:MAG: hypothetical protein NTZ78_01195 [Candidatus Aureabacteria bacterium]|nr:hypothetical protein [Candidatus Auribacterota bacterium]